MTTARLDARSALGTGSFDDRPMVAVGQHVGAGDRIEVAVSHDAGRTFGAPIAMPADGGHSAFGVRLAPLPGEQVAGTSPRSPAGS